jgi:protein-S-isoprenylcysteine O-methyltransferase Ste14
MALRIFYFILAILVPYFAEQYAYSRFINSGNKPENKDAEIVSQSYGWRLVWDAAYFLLFISAGYQIVIAVSRFSIWEWLGYICFLFGVVLRIWSLKEIGHFYDPGIVVKAGHQLVNTGPYHVLRHPLHLGTVLQITGLAFLAPIWLALPAVFASLWLCLYLNRTEDRTHAQLLSASFQSYYLKTWDLVDLIFWKNKME